MEGITVVASVCAVRGHEADVEAALAELVASTHMEEGCLRYALHRHSDDPGRFVIIEHWRDRESLQAHFERAHMAAFMVQAGPWLEGGSVVHVLEPLPKGQGHKGRMH